MLSSRKRQIVKGMKRRKKGILIISLEVFLSNIEIEIKMWNVEKMLHSNYEKNPAVKIFKEYFFTTLLT